MKPHATKTATAKRHSQHDIDDLSRFPSAGPNPCISGMKKQHWGVDAYCVRHGAYVYHVDYATWTKF